MVDATDRQLVDAMLADGRASLRELGDAVGVSATTVSTRLDELEDRVIEDVVPVIDYEAATDAITAIVRLQVDGTRREDVFAALRDRPALVSVYAVTGPNDGIAIGKFEGRTELDTALTEMLSIEGVRDVEADVARSVVSEFDQFAVADRG